MHQRYSFNLIFGVFILLNFGCESNSPDGSPTPLEEMLAVDDSLRAGGDSMQQHIVFDYENLNRVVWQKPEILINRFGDLSEKTIVEVGSGTGFFTRRLAKRAARVIALDIDPTMLLQLDSLNKDDLSPELYDRIDPRLVPVGDPNLGVQEADAALVANTFMYIKNRTDYLRKLKQGLKPGSIVLIVDFKKKDTPVGPPVAARIAIHEVEQAFRDAAYINVRTDDTTLDYQYMVWAYVPK